MAVTPDDGDAHGNGGKDDEQCHHDDESGFDFQSLGGKRHIGNETRGLRKRFVKSLVELSIKVFRYTHTTSRRNCVSAYDIIKLCIPECERRAYRNYRWLKV